MSIDKEKLKQVFRMFAAIDDLRDYLNSPLLKDGFYCATDAHSLIFVPESFDLGFEKRDKPEFLAVVPKNLHEPFEINISKIKKDVLATIPMIPETIDCDECEGCGTEECNLGHQHKCDECDGKGYFDHPNGNEIPDNTVVCVIENVGNIAYLQLGRFLNACEILGIEKINKIAGEKENLPRLFESAEIKFAIMPCLINKETKTINIKPN